MTIDTTQGHEPSSKSERNLIIVQVNIHGIKNKLEEHKMLIHDTHADIITIQETKLTPKENTLKVHNFTPVRADRLHKAGGGLITLNITFTTTDYNKTNGLSPTTRKLTGHNSRKTQTAFAQTTIPTNIHTANIIFTNNIVMADKHSVPKGNMHSNCMLLPDHIVCKTTQRNNIRRANTCDPDLKPLN